MNVTSQYFGSVDTALAHFTGLGYRPVAIRTRDPLLFAGCSVDDVTYVEIRQERPGLVVAEQW